MKGEDIPDLRKPSASGFDFTNVSKATSETVLAEPSVGSSFERTIPH